MLSLTNQSARAILDNYAPNLDGGSVDIYSAPRPAQADDAASGTLLVSIALQNPAFGAATDTMPGAQIEALGLPLQEDGVATGTAAWFRLSDSMGNAVLDGDVGVELMISDTSIGSGVPVRIDSFSITLGES